MLAALWLALLLMLSCLWLLRVGITRAGSPAVPVAKAAQARAASITSFQMHMADVLMSIIFAGVLEHRPHLKIVIGTKLRRQESFMMTWLPEDQDKAPGRLTIWMNPSIPLIIAFDNPTMPAIDPARIERMMENLNVRGELVLDQLG